MGSSKTAAAINVTPMIDILLVLLITFRLLPYHSKGLPSEVPEPAPQTQSSSAVSLDSVLRIRRDRSIDVDSK
jgi:biopolymer transport protein ExbD